MSSAAVVIGALGVNKICCFPTKIFHYIDAASYDKFPALLDSWLLDLEKLPVRDVGKSISE